MPNRVRTFLKFRSELIAGLFDNRGDVISKTVRTYPVDNSSRNVILNVVQGYGVAESVPLRVLAYVVPVLRLAGQLPGRSTMIRLYTATGGVLRANPGLDWTKIFQSSRIIRVLLKQYIVAFHPKLVRQKWTMECGMWLEIADEENVEETPEVSRAVELLMPYAREIMSGDATISQFCRNRGGEQALRYMVEHVLYMRDPIQFSFGEFEGRPLPGFFQHGRSSGDVIMVGGPAEKIFYRMRQGLLERIGTHNHWRSHQFFTRIGDPPTYHPQQGEPYANVETERFLSLDLQALLAKARSAGRGPLRDWIALLQDAACVERFTILPHQIGTDEMKILQKGYTNLMEWLRSLSFR